jgi:hypothetical protein
MEPESSLPYPEECTTDHYPSHMHISISCSGTTVTNQNLINKEIKSRLNLSNACYHSVQKLLSSRLLSKDVKIKMKKTIILPVVLYGFEMWAQILREGHRLRIFENTALRRIFGQTRDEMAGGGDNCIMRSFITCTLRLV